MLEMSLMSCISEETFLVCMATTQCYQVCQQIIAWNLYRNFKLLMDVKGNDGLLARCFKEVWFGTDRLA